ncbi:MAG: ArnT family glycosyltransferase [Armatimonadota bacterium]
MISTNIVAPVSLLSLLFASALLIRMLRPRGHVEAMLLWSLMLATEIVLLGYVLSAMHGLNNMGWWAVGSLVVLVLVCIPPACNPSLREVCLRKPRIPREIERRIAAADFRRFDTWLLLLPVATVILAGVVNYALVLSLEPANLDVLNYHLARIGFYLQQGHLGHDDANYWALIVHPKVATVLMLYTYKISGLACLTSFVQFLAYGITMLAIYGMARLLNGTRRGSLFAAMVFGLLTICLLEASTAQNDLVMAAFLGCAGFFLLRYRFQHAPRDLLLSGLAFALAAGVKANIIMAVPSLTVVALHALWPRRGETPYPRWRNLGIGLLGFLFALLIITLPSGYAENVRRYGHPIGPASVRLEHGYAGAESPGQLLRYGGLNLLRYTYRALSLDGVPEMTVTRSVQWILLSPLRQLFDLLHIDIESPAGCRRGIKFYPQMPFISNANTSGWGMLGFLLVWPVAMLFLLDWRRQNGVRIFAIASLLFFIVQAFVGPYDYFRGRYFIMGAVFALPPLAFIGLASRSWLKKSYLTVVLLLGCLSALCTVCIRYGTLVFPMKLNGRYVNSTFTLDRAAQLVREYPDMYIPFVTYESYVPDLAIVASDDLRYFTYLFQGENFSRTLIYLTPFDGDRRPLPSTAQFLLFTTNSPYAKHLREDDVLLCVNQPYVGTLYLRKLQGAWRLAGQ